MRFWLFPKVRLLVHFTQPTLFIRYILHHPVYQIVAKFPTTPIIRNNTPPPILFILEKFQPTPFITNTPFIRQARVQGLQDYQVVNFMPNLL